MYSANYEDHVGHVREVLETLRKHQLQVNEEKSLYCQGSWFILAISFRRMGYKWIRQKSTLIVDWPRPKTVIEIRSFHGMVNVYRKYIRHFLKISAPSNSTSEEGSMIQMECRSGTCFQRAEVKDDI